MVISENLIFQIRELIHGVCLCLRVYVVGGEGKTSIIEIEFVGDKFFEVPSTNWILHTQFCIVQVLK